MSDDKRVLPVVTEPEVPAITKELPAGFPNDLLPLQAVVELSGTRIAMLHIAGNPSRACC